MLFLSTYERDQTRNRISRPWSSSLLQGSDNLSAIHTHHCNVNRYRSMCRTAPTFNCSRSCAKWYRRRTRVVPDLISVTHHATVCHAPNDKTLWEFNTRPPQTLWVQTFDLMVHRMLQPCPWCRTSILDLRLLAQWKKGRQTIPPTCSSLLGFSDYLEWLLEVQICLLFQIIMSHENFRGHVEKK